MRRRSTYGPAPSPPFARTSREPFATCSRRQNHTRPPRQGPSPRRVCPGPRLCPQRPSATLTPRPLLPWTSTDRRVTESVPDKEGQEPGKVADGAVAGGEAECRTPNPEGRRSQQVPGRDKRTPLETCLHLSEHRFQPGDFSES